MFGIDFELYELFNSIKADDELLKHFIIQYPAKNMLSQEMNGIFIGLSEAKAGKKTHQSQEYNELVDIIITSKNNDFKESAKIFRAVAKRLIEILRSNKKYKDIMQVESFLHKYYGTEMKFGELLITFKSDEVFEESEDILEALSILEEITIKEESKKKGVIQDGKTKENRTKRDS